MRAGFGEFGGVGYGDFDGAGEGCGGGGVRTCDFIVVNVNGGGEIPPAVSDRPTLGYTPSASVLSHSTDRQCAPVLTFSALPVGGAVAVAVDISG